jgi:hypothetical protein
LVAPTLKIPKSKADPRYYQLPVLNNHTHALLPSCHTGSLATTTNTNTITFGNHLVGQKESSYTCASDGGAMAMAAVVMAVVFVGCVINGGGGGGGVGIICRTAQVGSSSIVYTIGSGYCIGVKSS